MNIESVIKNSFEPTSKLLCTLAEHSLAGVVVGGIITKDLPFDRANLVICGIIGAVLSFIFGIIFNDAAIRNKTKC